ncbi:MAG: hypothetical protein CVT72_05315 [Alphaproteobacteria bacterium HGW-Alphaproteobacteria-11]|nr:MAG: hypothetical protein CVT72_05315 [Alphaproteobacteria bacterium HGW-Alphaproteobacteria-11]
MTTAPTFTAALVQMRTGRDVTVNIADVSGLVSEAAAQGADLAITPEMTSLLETKSERLFASTFEEKDDPALAALRALAAARKIWLLIGSLPVKVSPQKLANRSFLIAPDGGIAARYDKIHMFDVDLAGGESYRESRNFEPGRAAVVAEAAHDEPGVVLVEIDTARIAEARARVPSLGYDRDFALPVVRAERRAS